MDKLPNLIKTPKLKATANVSNNAKKIANVTKTATKKAVNATKVAMNKAKGFLGNGSPMSYIIMGLLFIILILLVIYLTQNLINWFYSSFTKKKVLLGGTKDATTEMVINQDPDDENAINLPRSMDEDGGIEFTYSYWMFVSDWMNESGAEQHVFHKGERDGNVNFAPKVTLDGKDNKMYIYMNTFNDQNVKVEIDNMPVKKWVNVCIVIKHKIMDVYVNGFLKLTHEFDSLPKQNYRNVYINREKGFVGYLSRLEYYSYALTYFDIQSIINKGPSQTVLSDVSGTFSQMPPYFASQWWYE
jgi:hypothetical protein